ncbi:WW domain-containing adapter protein with coiled-coil-like isoform X2 [Seriola lalandi dorsalis]|uniref:WW domain-containing adapter protein with coiled-coil-like isoform X2 n=1 Tax=Seriola lalandi dorsalis TaxID=1841481 RepID=UPI000C6FA7D0|nr:WW domain-containing adapter protein with coiled-coil-like isoform X2 [Seriola lalandi dorsalis]XP_056248128.1 WW domain-containing adapter protein with coiled-coil-like isoform X2 [Seriola aureovittata]
MVMYARKPTRVSDGCNDRRDSQSYQTHKSQPKSQSSSLHRYDKVRDGSSDPTPPYKMLRRSDESPVSRHGDSTGHGKAKTSHTIRGKNGTSGSPQENSHNNSSHHGSDSHAAQNKPADRHQDPADDWTEHISSSGKKYYYNCRTEVSQWEKPKDLLEREQRQKDSVKMAANSFPRDMDYRQEALQDKATSKTTSGDQSTASNAGHSSSSSSSQSLNSAPGALGSTPSTMSSSSSSSTGQLLQSVQSPSPALLQDPALLHQLLPALQATLQMNNGSMDMAKLNEVLAAAVTQASLRSVLHKLLTAGPAFNVTALLSAAQHSNQAQHSSQSPVSLTSDASSPRPYVSPRNGTPQSNQKSLLGVHPSSITSSQTRGSMSSGKQGPVNLSQSAEKRPEDPRTLQQRSSGQTQTDTPGSFTPTLAAHFDETLIRHIQGWPSENTEKQAARLHEDIHNMGSLYMSEICTEMKNLRSLVRVCEIQATLREQRILFLRQQSKELDKLKNQNSYMV